MSFLGEKIVNIQVHTTCRRISRVVSQAAQRNEDVTIGKQEGVAIGNAAL